MTESAVGSRQSAEGDGVAWTISPQPDEDEMAALAVALTTFLAAEPPSTAGAAAASRWARAGREAALLGLRGGPRTGWGRRLDRAVPA